MWSLAAPEWVYRFRRIRRQERMDEAGLPTAERDDALRGLERIATWWGQRQPLLDEVILLAGPPGHGRLRVVEIGAGSGSMARWMQEQLLERGYRAEVLATDLHRVKGVRKLDTLKGRLPAADIYFSNLFLHHLPDAALPKLFAAQARACRLGFIHYDLQRHWAHFYGASLRIKLAGLPRINWLDGLRSIQQGYTRAELQALADQGAPGARLQWTLPCRWRLTWKKS